MAVRNALLGGTDYTEEGLKPSDENDTNDAIINQQIDDNGFTLVDTDITGITNTTTALKRTYTFTKAVDVVEFICTLTNNLGSGSTTYVEFYKNAGQITSNLRTGNGFLESPSQIRRVSSQLQGAGGIDIAGSMFINESFAASDTLEIYAYVDAASTGTIENIRVKGINNKTTDTTWVTIT